MPRLEIVDGNLAYEIAGRGEALLLIAGLGGQGSFWQRQIEAFAQHFRTITFDHRGVGLSAGAPPYSVEQWTQDVVALLDHLGIDNVHLVGHSTGGVIAQITASEHPERVASVVLSGTWANADERFRRVFTLRRDVLVALGTEAYSLLGWLLTAPADELFDRIPQQQAAPDVIAARIDALQSYEGPPRLRQIHCPTLVIAAADDVLIPPHMSQRVADGIAGARMCVFHDGGHAFPRTRAVDFNRTVLEFLSQHARQLSDACTGKKHHLTPRA